MNQVIPSPSEKAKRLAIGNRPNLQVRMQVRQDLNLKEGKEMLAGSKLGLEEGRRRCRDDVALDYQG